MSANGSTLMDARRLLQTCRSVQHTTSLYCNRKDRTSQRFRIIFHPLHGNLGLKNMWQSQIVLGCLPQKCQSYHLINPWPMAHWSHAIPVRRSHRGPVRRRVCRRGGHSITESDSCAFGASGAMVAAGRRTAWVKIPGFLRKKFNFWNNMKHIGISWTLISNMGVS